MKYILKPTLLPHFAILFIVMILVGCAQATTPTSHPTAIPTIIFAPTFTPQPTATITLTPTASTTPTPSITRTSSLTRTPFPTETLGLTEAAYETYKAPTLELIKLTRQAVSTLNVTFPSACGYDYPSISPDGNWLADDCDAFHVSSRDGQKQIVITHGELAPPETYLDAVIVYGWSRDSQYIYFSPRICCVDSDIYGRGSGLYRLDVQSSKWIKFLDQGGGYSFSPTGRRLVNTTGGTPVKFRIIDLQTNAEQLVMLQNFQQATVTEWSPDGRRFAATAKNGSIISGDDQYALFIVSLDNLSITQLIPLSKHRVYASKWSDDDVITVDDCFYDGTYEMCKQLLYDLKVK